MTCPLPANWSPTDGCYPPNFASQCASLKTPAKLLPVWWRNACVSYDLQKSASRWLDYATAAQIVQGAFAKWTGVMCPVTASGATRVSINVNDLGPVECDQVQYQPDQPNQHVIVFRDSSWPHNDSSNTLGLTTVTFEVSTGELYDADTEINGTLPLSVGDPVPQGSYDVESIITHEMGHFLGLAHSGDTSATMFARYSRGSTSMRALGADDVAGLCSIYPPDGTRVVDPSVAQNGTVAEARCDPTPRHGFSSRCSQPPTGGCAVASGGVAGWGAGIVLAALLSLAISRRGERPSVGKRAP
jgi:hypothetical protein